MNPQADGSLGAIYQADQIPFDVWRLAILITNISPQVTH